MKDQKDTWAISSLYTYTSEKMTILLWHILKLWPTFYTETHILPLSFKRSHEFPIVLYLLFKQVLYELYAIIHGFLNLIHNGIPTKYVK